MRRVRSRAVRASSYTLEAALLCLSCAILVAFARPAQAMPGRIACSLRGPPGSAVNRGPCNTPDAVDYAAVGPQGRAVVLTNFGLLLPGDQSTSWQIVCDDNFGIPKPPQMRVHPDGRILVPSLEGLYASADSCAWSSSSDIGMTVVFDVSFDRTGANVYALVDIPRKLWRSTDGGKTFSVLTALPDQPIFRVAVSPADPERLYLIGRGARSSTPFGRSQDGGQTFEYADLAMAGNPPPINPLEFVAASPSDPAVLYFYVINPTDGDEIWRTTDGGQTVSKILGLTNAEAFAGFTFGATADTMYVAGSDPFPLGERTPAHLYVTHDGGKTWDAPIPSSTQEGPRYRCLSWSDGKLYACGAGEPGGDPFLVGVSTDEGKNWAAAVKLRQVSGARSCVQSRCLKTEEWLCEYYCICAPGTQPSSGICVPPGGGSDGGARDAGTDALPMANACVGSACNEKQGWCTVGGRATPAGLPRLMLLACLFIGLYRARHVRR
jgi:photosystem II stability/assembly factor-like uncharacterized protein